MDKNLKISLSKKLALYGRFSGSYRQPLSIIIHGLLGNMDEELYDDAARWLQKKGFAVFRFNLYSHEQDARQLRDCTLTIHASDLDVVIQYFRRRRVKKIFVIGHSFGGLVIFQSIRQDFDGAVLWDPSYRFSFTRPATGMAGGKYIKALDGYLMNWGVNVVIGRKMVQEVDALSWENIAADFHVPFRVISAGSGVLKSAKHYLRHTQKLADQVIIKGASHYFGDSPFIRNQLFTHSLAWFKKFL